MNKGFTLIELVVAITVIAVLSGIILFAVNQYINKGKDSNIYANLAVLIPAGEVFYNGNNDSYQGFCDPNINSVIKNAEAQMPSGANPKCNEDSANNYQAWAACAKEFTNPLHAYCVDSRGFKEEMCNSLCTSALTQCPDPTQSSCQ